MKSVSRRVATFLVVAIISLPIAPLASAARRDDRDHFKSKLVHVIKKFQRFVTISLDDFPIPPRP
jgi:hypothetical protein